MVVFIIIIITNIICYYMLLLLLLFLKTFLQFTARFLFVAYEPLLSIVMKFQTLTWRLNCINACLTCILYLW